MRMNWVPEFFILTSSTTQPVSTIHQFFHNTHSHPSQIIKNPKLDWKQANKVKWQI